MSGSGFLGRGIGPCAFGGGAAADWWPIAGATCIAAYQPKGAASLAASYVNLATPGVNDIVVATAPTLVAAGWKFVAASNQYLLSPVLLNGSVHSVVCRFVATNTGCVFGTFKTSTIFYTCEPNTVGGIVYRLTTGSGGVTVAPAFSSGIVAMIPGKGGYRDGVSDTALGTIGSTSDVGLAIGGRISSVGFGVPFGGTVAAISIYSDNPAVVQAGLSALVARMAVL